MVKGEIKLETYKRSTNLIKARFEKINAKVTDLMSKAIDTPLTQVQIKSLNTYLTEMRKKRADFEGNFQRVVEHADEDEISESDLSADVDAVNELYIAVVSQIESLLPSDDPLSPTSAANVSFQNIPPTPQHVRLPQLDLKTFNGDVSNWVAYINLFDATVHQNPTLTSVIKFQYLLSSLTGEPLNLIKSMNISAANYPVAYQILKDRYHSSRRLSTLHLNAILDLPNITAGNTKGLRNFLNLFTEHTQSLRALQCDIAGAANPLLSAHLLRKLDQELRKKLENFRSSQECDVHSLPTVHHIIQFLNEECNQTEDASLHFPQTDSRSSVSNPNKQRNPRFAENKTQSAHRAHAMVAAQDAPMPRVSHAHPPSSGTSGARSRTPHPSLTCFACNREGHKIYSCDLFLSKTPSERSSIVKSHKRCYSCLGAHMLDKCTSKNVCSTCQRKHHSLLHFDRKSSPISTPNKMAPLPLSQAQPPQHTQSSNTLVAHAAHSNSQAFSHEAITVLLGTALVKVTASNGNTHVLRCLIDSGSQLSFVSEHAVQLLNAPRVHSTHEVTGISATTSRTKGVVHLNLSTLGGKLIASQHPLHILDRISSDLPRVRISPDVWQLTRPYVLADPTFDRPGRVDLLIGGALYPLLFTQESHALGQNLPHLVGTHFGYVVMGVAPCDFHSPSTSYFVALHSACDSAELHSSLQRFWTQEEPPSISRKSKEEDLCDQHFLETHSRTEEGRYVVRLPLKPNAPFLGNSQQIAEKRLYSLERKFKTQPQFHNLYVTFMRDCENSNYMTKVIDTNISSSHCFLPHHGVVKQNGDLARIRVVYDASCPTSNGHSLNDILLTGPKLQTNICDVLLRFRTHNVVFTCDIRQMYQQILVHPSDQQYQMVLWRENTSDPLSIYKLSRVTFGVNCSPYLAIRTLHQLAQEEGKDFPEAAGVLQEQTYIDDIVTGSHSVEAARDLQQQLIQLLRRGHFELRKWTSSSPELLQSLPETHRDTPVFLEATKEPQFTILGLHWSPESDTFNYQLNLSPSLPTKRSVLSTIAKIYDPCGFLAPCIMQAKCFMQLLWTQHIQWDEPLSPELKIKWDTFVSALSSLTDISVPRALQISPSASVELHGFSDASESGYAAVLYFRSQQPNGEVVVRQVLAKTRVAPLKRVTLPRLELCAASLLAQLTSHCCALFKNSLPQLNYFLWCDSSVTLTWLQTPSYKLKTYVANRVAQTQELVSSSSWRYVPTQHNPADCASRGILASELVSHPLWWTGPPWLSMPPSHWPEVSFTPVDISSSSDTKATPLSVLTTTFSDEWDLLTKFSSWSRLHRVMAYILRFTYNLKHQTKQRGPLSTQELKKATSTIMRLIQASNFRDDLVLLKNGSPCSSRLQRLSPFIDQEGMIRVGGRLGKSTLPYEVVHPILLPKKHAVVSLIIDHVHRSQLHSGPQLTQALICQQYWILSARQAIRSRIFQCVTCFKAKPRNNSPLMGDLPSPRVTPSRPFTSTGCDYCGHFSVKIHNLRAIRQIKVYICVFVCLATKAVHLEVVTDLTTDAYLAALTRFSSRRGLPSHLYSDCGTNFVGADAALRKLLFPSKRLNEFQEEIVTYSSQRGIQFHFNAPASPHMGGLWESAVKSAKYHLRRVMGDIVLPLTEFITLTTKIEAALNSRPLTPLSNDPSDCTTLTPGHFLIGAPLAAVPEPDLAEIPTNRLKHWQLIQALYQRFWKRWQLEYLNTLQQRCKWNTTTSNLKVGDLVLIHQNTPPQTWPLARVTAVRPGSDGVVRVVDLMTPTGHFTRPSVKVFPLPLN